MQIVAWEREREENRAHTKTHGEWKAKEQNQQKQNI